MQQTTQGLHHITAITSDPQQNLDFYTRVLGLRLVKLTVNFDDPGTYHIYYGDATGSPGTILTFFPWNKVVRGQPGYGQVSTVAFLAPSNSIGFWQEHLKINHISSTILPNRFNDEILAFQDPNGLPLELVAREGAAEILYWNESIIDGRYAIRGLAGPTLLLNKLDKTATLLSKMFGLSCTESFEQRYRFRTGGSGIATHVDLIANPNETRGRMGTGVVHHLAWRAPNLKTLEDWRKILVEQFFNVSPVQDRKYFQSIYFREPGGILFEISTDPPGFTLDENEASLGTRLMLPAWLEPRRQSLVGILPPLNLPNGISAFYSGR